MDFKDCYSILSARATNTPATNEQQPEVTGSTETRASTRTLEEDFTELEPLELVRKFHDLQRERIKTYRYFDDELADIIKGNCPARYPLICSEVTNKFSRLSASINAVKVAASKRDMKDIAACIGRIQSSEKEKLTLVAAHHLDQLKSTVLSGTEHITGEKTEQQVKYLADQISACQVSISEAMEELQCAVCDLE